jgi:phosphotriesterase-related protein
MDPADVAPTPFVRTVLGDVPASELGATLPHEHLVVDWSEMLGRPKLAIDRDATCDLIVAKLELAADAGIGAIGEVTPIGTGRYVDLFVDVARRTRVHIVASTGFFHESWCPIHPLAAALDVDGLTDLFVREITEGMGSTTVRAGLIKVATGEGRISPKETEIVRAAARASLATGCPIITHQTGGLGLEQLDLFAAEGLAAERVIVTHVGQGPDPSPAALALADRGATISVDQISYPGFTDAAFVRVVAAAVAAGHGGRVVLGHDALVISHGPDERFGAVDVSDYAYILREFVPKLRAAGLTDEDIAAILVANPARALAFRS